MLSLEDYEKWYLETYTITPEQYIDDELLQFADENPIPQKWYDEEPIQPPQESKD